MNIKSVQIFMIMECKIRFSLPMFISNIDSVFKMDKTYSLQVFLGECKCMIKEKRYILQDELTIPKNLCWWLHKEDSNKETSDEDDYRIKCTRE